MTSQTANNELANVSTDLTSLANARVRVRLDAASRNADTVGSVLGRYRTQAGLTVEALADWLGLDLPVLADLAEELQPGDSDQELGLEQLAELYGADRARLLEAFEHGG